MSVILVLALILIFSGVVTAVEAIENTDQIAFTSSGEEKVYCNATTEDEFADNRVMVVLSNDASLDFNIYEAADFSEIDCAAVDDLSEASGKKYRQRWML